MAYKYFASLYHIKDSYFKICRCQIRPPGGASELRLEARPWPPFTTQHHPQLLQSTFASMMLGLKQNLSIFYATRNIGASYRARFWTRRYHTVAKVFMPDASMQIPMLCQSILNSTWRTEAVMVMMICTLISEMCSFKPQCVWPFTEFAF